MKSCGSTHDSFRSNLLSSLLAVVLPRLAYLTQSHARLQTTVCRGVQCAQPSARSGGFWIVCRKARDSGMSDP